MDSRRKDTLIVFSVNLQEVCQRREEDKLSPRIATSALAGLLVSDLTVGYRLIPTTGNPENSIKKLYRLDGKRNEND